MVPQKTEQINPLHCEICNKTFVNTQGLSSHLRSKLHNQRARERERNPPSSSSSSVLPTKDFKDISKSYQLNKQTFIGNDFTIFFRGHLKKLNDILKTLEFPFRYYISFRVIYKHKDGEVHSIKFFADPNNIAFNINDISTDKLLNDALEVLEKDNERLHKSGWVIKGFNKLMLHIDNINTLAGETYQKLPFKSRELINIKNYENKCFLWCILAKLNPASRDKERVSKYKEYEDSLNTSDLTFPVMVYDNNIDKFERKNNLRINIYEIKLKKEKSVKAFVRKNKDPTVRKNWYTVPLRVSKNTEENEESGTLKRVDLILYENHYILIKKLTSWIRGELNYNLRDDQKLFLCHKCLSYFVKETAYESHKRLCINNEPTKYIFPNKDDNILKFTNYGYKIRVPYIMVGDIECINKEIIKINEEGEEVKKIKQIPSHIFIILISEYPDILASEEKLFEGENCMQEFTEYLTGLYDKVNEALKTKIEYIPNEPGDSYLRKNTSKCYFCEKSLTEKGTVVIDHDHYNGAFRGIAHWDCNINAKKPKSMPIYFHNGGGYDFHYIVKNIAKYVNLEGEKEVGDIFKIIPKTDEGYISFSYMRIFNFVDSYRLFLQSLDGIVKTLNKENNLLLNEFCEKINKKEFVNDLRNKGVYPYDYIDSFEKYNETEILPIKAFDNKLNNSFIEDLNKKKIDRSLSKEARKGYIKKYAERVESYERYKDIYKKFDCRCLNDYTILYLKQDVLLLADCLQNFRDLFVLDPAHFVSAPSLTWQLGLYKTGIELELITEQSTFEMIERGIRGGFSGVLGSRYVKARNKDTLEDQDLFEIDPLEEDKINKIISNSENGFVKDDSLVEFSKSNYILYLDATNLYGWAMSEPLPTKDFKEIENINEPIEYYLEQCNNEYGMIFEVDLEYKEIEFKHRLYPLAPETKKRKYEELSDYQKSLLNGTYNSTPKLILDLQPKKNYVVHYRNLEFYLKHGMKVTKIHRVLTFTQSSWLKEYISYNTKRRAESKTKFGDYLFKLMNNAFFGKTMENLRKRVNIRLFADSKICKKQITKPTFKNRKIFSDGLMAVHYKKQFTKMNKPMYLGFSILELSKLLMYRFVYETLVPKFGKRMEILYKDTDSLVLNIKSDDVYKELEDIKSEFDFSNYKINQPQLFSTENKKIPGYFKDETAGNPITEFCVLKSKSYGYKTLYEDEEGSRNVDKCINIKNKGTKEILNQESNIEEIKKCLLDGVVVKKTNTLIESKMHDSFVIDREKIAFNSFDDKRCHLNNIDNIPFY